MKTLIKLTLAATCLAGAATAETAKERAARCAVQGEMVAAAIEMRLKRQSEKKVKAALAESADDSMQEAVPLLVGYVFTLSRKDMKTLDIPTAFTEQCAAFSG